MKFIKTININFSYAPIIKQLISYFRIIIYIYIYINIFIGLEMNSDVVIKIKNPCATYHLCIIHCYFKFHNLCYE